jgi:hypothetical protein
MQISKTAVGLIVAAGVTAGAGGAFLTTRSAAPETVAGEAAAVDLVRVDDPGSPIDANAVVSTDGFAGRGELPPPAPEYVEPARPAPRPRRQAEVRMPAPPAALPEAPAAAPPPSVDERPLTPAEPIGIIERDAPRPPEPARPELIELVVSADSVIGLQLDSTISSERARVEDPVDAHVVRDVRVGDRVAIPAGAKVTGLVTLVDRGGRIKERARLGVRFTEVELPNGTRLPIQTETVFREGESQATSSSAKIGGGAIGGAILGGILGGAKGAAIGGSVGAGAGTAAVMAGGRNQATLTSGTPVTVRIEQPIVVTTER